MIDPANVKFDFEDQVWRSIEDLSIVEEQYNWSYPCQHCNSPAEFTGMNAIYEFYTCHVCKRRTNVN